VRSEYCYVARVAASKRSWTVLLILATGMFGFFNAIAIGLFFWADATSPTSDANAGLSVLSVVVAWVGDLVALVLAVVGAIVGRQRASAILWGLAVILFAIGSASFAALAGLVSAVAHMPVPIH